MEVNNYGRSVAYRTFSETLNELRGQSGVTEIGFRDAWRARLHADERLTTNGWYDPPAEGMAVLFADEIDVRRVCFESLRLEAFGPSNRVIDWERGLMYGYCSPVDRQTGLAGDFGVTLYFGTNSDMIEYFRKCSAVTQDLLAGIDSSMTSTALFQHSEKLFDAVGLRNTIASVTDSVPLDLGHSMPSVEVEAVAESRVLPQWAKDSMRASRRFVGTSSNWPLSDTFQFTVEPQLVDPERPESPKVSFHYVVSVRAGTVTVLREGEQLLAELGLIRDLGAR